MKNNWRNICKEFQKNHTEKDMNYFFKKTNITLNNNSYQMSHMFNYRFEHTIATVKIARWLAITMNADLDIVECAAWLHDCKKFLSNQQTYDTHANDAAVAIDNILEETNFPKEKINNVRHAIKHHTGYQLKAKLYPLETACLWDADKLSKLGAAGILHYFSIKNNIEQTDTSSIIKNSKQWLKKACLITQSMNTNAAIQEAQKRFKFTTKFYQQLQNEWTNPMKTIP